jgi:hypothetical protein
LSLLDSSQTARQRQCIIARHLVGTFAGLNQNIVKVSVFSASALQCTMSWFAASMPRASAEHEFAISITVVTYRQVSTLKVGSQQVD